MKYCSLFLLPLFFAFSLHAKQVIYPQLNTVIGELYKSYDVPQSVAEHTLHFAKKPEGWFVQWTDATKFPAAVISEELFWSAKQLAYLPLSTIKSGKTPITEEVKNQIFPYGDRYNYSRNPYYGYIGFDKDVIHDFSEEKILADTMLEGLGRAFSNYAFGFTEHSYGFHVLNPGLDEKMKLDSFVHYEQFAIATFDRLRKQNSNYEMLAGCSNTKYADEIMSFYDYLLLFGKENIAAPYFKEDLFDPLLLGFARSVLEECDPNAILFTNGDNDTFPLEYLQFVKGVRSDVTLLNLSMMNLASTLEQAGKGKGKALPVKFSFDMKKYAEKESDYFQNENIEPDPITYEEFLNKIKLQQIKGEDQSSDYSYYNFPNCTISIATHFSFFKEIENLVPDSALMIDLHKSYLLRSDFAQLDVILSNLNERPIYYTITCGELNITIDKYLFSEGVVNRFIPFEISGGNPKLMFGQNFLPVVMYDNLMKINFSYAPGIDKYVGPMFVTNFKMEYILLAYELSALQPEKAIRLLNYCDSLFPPSEWEYGAMWAYGVQTYYECGQKEKGDRIAMRLLSDFEVKVQDTKTPPDANEKYQMNAAVKIIKRTASDFDRSVIVDWSNNFLKKNKIEEN